MSDQQQLTEEEMRTRFLNSGFRIASEPKIKLAPHVPVIEIVSVSGLELADTTGKTGLQNKSGNPEDVVVARVKFNLEIDGEACMAAAQYVMSQTYKTSDPKYTAEVRFVTGGLNDNAIRTYFKHAKPDVDLSEKGLSDVVESLGGRSFTQLEKTLIPIAQSVVAASKYKFEKTSLMRTVETSDLQIGARLTVDVMKELIKIGADVNAVDMSSNGGDPSCWSLIHYAARDANPAKMQILIDAGANLNGVNDEGKTPLMIARGKARAILENALLKQASITVALAATETNPIIDRLNAAECHQAKPNQRERL